VVHTKVIGETTEAIVLAEFVKAGFPVLLPFGENLRYDMVIEAGSSLLRVQCKTASPCGRNGDKACLVFHAYSARFVSRKFDGREDYRDQADLFAAYAPSTGQVYVLAVDEVPRTDVWLRLTPTKNNQQRGVRMAAEHTLEAWAARRAAASPSDVLSAAGRL
jgi:PD-(D/E)XK nuclease superfamily protein